VKVIGRAGVGLDNFNLDACRARGVRVVYTPDANTQAVVEYVLGLMLDHVRPRAGFGADIDADKFHQMRKVHVGRQLDTLTLGVWGFGRIGKRLTRVAQTLGMRVLCHDLIPEAELRAAVDFDFQLVSREQLLAESDILSVHVDGRSENRAMINAAVLTQLKPSCMLINAARGMLVDDHALAAWARQVASAKGGDVRCWMFTTPSRRCRRTRCWGCRTLNCSRTWRLARILLWRT